MLSFKDVVDEKAGYIHRPAPKGRQPLATGASPWSRYTPSTKAPTGRQPCAYRGRSFIAIFAVAPRGCSSIWNRNHGLAPVASGCRPFRAMCYRTLLPLGPCSGVAGTIRPLSLRNCDRNKLLFRTRNLNAYRPNVSITITSMSTNMVGMRAKPAFILQQMSAPALTTHHNSVKYTPYFPQRENANGRQAV